MEEEPFEEQSKCLYKYIANIYKETEANDIVCVLSGPDNYRYGIATIKPYKGNREGMKKPREFERLYESIGKWWPCVISDGIEADDECGIIHTEEEGSLLAYIDKDLLTLPGKKYNYVSGVYKDIDYDTARLYYCGQIMSGDRTDNIPGLYAVTGKRFTKAIKEELKEADNPYSIVEREWEGYEAELREVKNLLYILRSRHEARIVKTTRDFEFEV